MSKINIAIDRKDFFHLYDQSMSSSIEGWNDGGNEDRFVEPQDFSAPLSHSVSVKVPKGGTLFWFKDFLSMRIAQKLIETVNSDVLELIDEKGDMAYALWVKGSHESITERVLSGNGG